MILDPKYTSKTSVPSKAIFCQIGPALWKIDSTDFVKMNYKDFFFLGSWVTFQPWSYHFGARTPPILWDFVELAKQLITLDGTLSERVFI